MGAFGENTMAFEQWIQFVLVPRLRGIVRDRDEFPSGSQIAVYAIRALDGDMDAERLHELLDALDRLVERVNGGTDTEHEDEEPAESAHIDTVTLGDRELPAVVYSLVEVLPQFEGEDLESQLQTFDTFLATLSPAARPELSALLQTAAAATTNTTRRARIEHAARAVARGDSAAEPYSHEEAMKKYQEKHRRSFGP